MTPIEVSQLYTRWHKRLISFAFKLMKTKEAAEDAVQDSFINIQRRVENAPLPALEYSLMYTVVKNTCIDKLRLNKKMPTGEIPYYIGFYELSVCEKIDQALCESIIKKAIETLSREEKKVVSMLMSGMERKDICAATGKRPTTVDCQRLHAISLIKKAIKKYNITLYGV